jgi:hypothetical protein
LPQPSHGLYLAPDAKPGRKNVGSQSIHPVTGPLSEPASARRRRAGRPGNAAVPDAAGVELADGVEHEGVARQSG